MTKDESKADSDRKMWSSSNGRSDKNQSKQRSSMDPVVNHKSNSRIDIMFLESGSNSHITIKSERLAIKTSCTYPFSSLATPKSATINSEIAKSYGSHNKVTYG